MQRSYRGGDKNSERRAERRQEKEKLSLENFFCLLSDMKISLQLFLTFFTVVFCINCSQQTIPIVRATNIQIPASTPQIIKAEAKIINKKADGLKVTETFLPSKENLSKVFFVDENNGWLVGSTGESDEAQTENIYRTENSGRSWQKVSIKTEKGSGVRDIFFVNALVGWLNIQRIGGINGNSSKSWLMKTNDGGTTWQNLLTQNFTEINEIKFINENNGWITGSTHNPKNVYNEKAFIRETTDGGKSWIDISKDLLKKNSYTDSRQLITGLIAETPNKVKVVTFGREFFKTEDAGKTWQQFGPVFYDLPAQVTTENFGKTGNNLLRVAGGADSIEGIFSYIATEEKNNDWTLRWFSEAFCLFDVAYLSENNVFVCGRLSADEKSPKSIKRIREPVIYYSSDNGATWTIVYQTSQFKNGNLISNLNSITKVSDNHLISVGDNGLIVNIEVENLAK
ncbi:MAG: WD40/YVTN/BNR-like repeat-containing protein [Pyrinomonadaceae bacterium]